MYTGRVRTLKDSFNIAKILNLQVKSHISSSKLCFKTEYRQSNVSDECQSLMGIIEWKASSNFYVSLPTIKKATTLLGDANSMTEDKALQLLSLCGNKVAANTNLKIHQAHAIFGSVEHKTIKLVNQLLQIYVDIKHPFNSSQILQRILKLNLKPNSETFFKLIAGNCLLGQVGNAKEFLLLLQDKGIAVPLNLYSYFALALSKSGYPNHAVMIIDQLLQYHSKLSWNVFCPLFCGLANQDEAFIVDTLTKYRYNFKNDMCIYHAMAIYEALVPYKNKSLISHFIKLLEIDQQAIVISYHHMQLLPKSVAALFLKELFLNFKGSYDKSNLPAVQYPILAYCLQNQENFEMLWDTMMFLKKSDSRRNYMEYLTLAVILKYKPNFCKRFVHEMSENNINLEFPIPPEYAKQFQIPENIFHSLNHECSKLSLGNTSELKNDRKVMGLA